MDNFIKPEQFPYTSATGFEYDSGDYQAAMDLCLEKLGYEELRAEQAKAREEGRLIGIGVASFTEVVGAGPSKTYDIAGLKMFDSAELRIHPTGKGVLKLGVKSQGQGHETTFAQIVAEELGIPPEDIEVQEGDTDNTPVRARHVREPLDADRRRGHVGGRAEAAREGADDRRASARVRRGRSRVDRSALLRSRARPTAASPSRTACSPRTRTCRTGWSTGSRASPTTTRRT